MTARETVPRNASHESEKQAVRALLARAAALRARQSVQVDAAALVREGREELERRGTGQA